MCSCVHMENITAQGDQVHVCMWNKLLESSGARRAGTLELTALRKCEVFKLTKDKFSSFTLFEPFHFCSVNVNKAKTEKSLVPKNQQEILTEHFI